MLGRCVPPKEDPLTVLSRNTGRKVPGVPPRRDTRSTRGGIRAGRRSAYPGGVHQAQPRITAGVRRPTVRQALLDAAVAGLALAATAAILAAQGLGIPDPTARHLDPLGIALAVLSAAPLAARRHAPATVFAISATASLALLCLGYPLDAPVPTVIAAYALAAAYSGAPPARRWPALATLNAFVPAVALAYASTGVHVWDIATELLSWAAVFTGVWIAGDRHRLRVLRLAQAHAYASRLKADADRERRLIAAHERTRIARELHDSAGHAINVILVQAGAARLLQQRNPPGARQAIETIEKVARDTIGDIDRLVHALRDDDGDIPADPGALNELVEHHRMGGLTITADLPSATPLLPRSVAWAAYRIVQEALTNAARHGSGSAAVAVRFHHRHVEIDVTNPTRPATTTQPTVRGGHGIIGMRERVTLLGGTLDAGITQERFRLYAVLPNHGTLA
jgi:signal transduction histidine kinase